jgi:hypothetical protein
MAGRRYRPTLEDFIEFLVLEGLAEARSGWRDVLDAGRWTRRLPAHPAPGGHPPRPANHPRRDRRPALRLGLHPGRSGPGWCCP